MNKIEQSPLAVNSDKQLTWKEACNWASSFLLEKETKAPQFEAELLLRTAGSLTRAQLFARWDEELTSEVWRKYKIWVEERATHKPIQYIIGEQEFYGRSFCVDERVLIPRPETELLVEHGLRRLQTGMLILDIGTGSGAIAISMLLEADKSGIDIEVVALDISADALAVARHNASRLLTAELQKKITWVVADVWPQDARSKITTTDEVQTDGLQKQKFDMILSNPPYIAASEVVDMDREVAGYEPHTALFASEQGLAIYDKIVKGLDKWLINGGWLGLELGYRQAPQLFSLLNVEIVKKQGSKKASVCDKITTYKINEWELIRDYAGHERILFYKKN